MADDEKLTLGEMLKSCCGIVEGKRAIDDRPHVMLFHDAAHVLEIPSTADGPDCAILD